jgi:hypothetical protein
MSLPSPQDTVHIVLHNSPGEATNYFSPPYFLLYITFLAGLLIVFRKYKRLLFTLSPREYEVNLPGFNLKGEIRYTTYEQTLAWKTYVELTTRISGNRLASKEGIVREALSSLHQAFSEIRSLLKNIDLEKIDQKNSNYTATSLILIIMNSRIRPFLSKWHPLLQQHENENVLKTSAYEHEQNWKLIKECRDELETLEKGIADFIIELRNIAEGKNNRSAR